MDEGDDRATAEGERSTMWRLYRVYGRENAGYAGAGLVGTVAGRLFGLLPAYVVGLAVDAIFLQQRPFTVPFMPTAWLPATRLDQLWLAVGLLVGAALLGTAFSWLQAWAWSVFAQRVQYGLRTDAYEALQAMDLAYFARRRTGELMAVLNNDVDQLQNFLEDGLSSALRVVTVIGGIGVILFAMHVPLALVSLLPVLVLVAFTLGFLRVVEPRYYSIRERVGDLNARLENNVSGIETVKTENAARYEVERVRAAAGEYLAAALRAIRVQVAFFPGLSLISGLGFALVFALGGYWVLGGSPFGAALTPGEFVTFTIYVQQFVWPVVEFGGVVDDYGRANAAARRVDALLTETPAIRDPTEPEPLAVEAGTVTYDAVSFTYEGREADTLDDVSFTVDGGDTVGVVGPTGAGKSTLCKLLVRLYDPDEGAVRIDGQDVRDVSLADLRSAVGYVSQEPFLFYGTVAENVRYGSFDASDEAVEAAARAAQAHAFVSNLPQGYDTLVGERGVRLSGGQRQRIALARAILKQPEILVLDEATSAVDTETEALIQRALADVTADRTAFVIAHRLSTVRNADRVLVMDEGRIVEDGTHEELLDADGLYANLWRVQVGELAALSEAFIERARERVDDVGEE